MLRVPRTPKPLSITFLCLFVAFSSLYLFLNGKNNTFFHCSRRRRRRQRRCRVFNEPATKWLRPRDNKYEECTSMNHSLTSRVRELPLMLMRLARRSNFHFHHFILIRCFANVALTSAGAMCVCLCLTEQRNQNNNNNNKSSNSKASIIIHRMNHVV